MAIPIEHKHGGAFAERQYIDLSNGAWAEVDASFTYLWDNAGLTWVKGNADPSGNLLVSTATQTLLFASVDTASSGDNTIVAANATKKIKVVSYALVAAGTVTARWKSGAADNLGGAFPLVSNSGVAIAGTIDSWLTETAVNKALMLNLSGAVQVSGHVGYFLQA